MKKINLKKFNMLVESKLGDIKPMISENVVPFFDEELLGRMGETFERVYNECTNTGDYLDFADDCPSCLDFYFEVLKGRSTFENNVDMQDSCTKEIARFFNETDDDLTLTMELFVCMNKKINDIEDFK